MRQTSPTTISKTRLTSQPFSSGFTLLELMVVLAIMAAVVSFAVVRFGGSNEQKKSVYRDFITLSKQIQVQAKLTGTTYRLAIQFEGVDEKGKPAPAQYWLESSSQSALIRSRDPKTLLTEEPVHKTEFTKDSTILKGGRELPRSMKFIHVELAGENKLITQGVVYIHFFPQGLAEESVIVLEDHNGFRSSIVIHPLTGKAEVVPREASIRWLRDE